MIRTAFPIFLLLALAAPARSAPIDFKREIEPILAGHCHSCHGPDKQKGGLRLDLKSAAQHGGDAGPAFIAARSGDSALIKRVRGDDPDDLMPPKGDRLTKEQVALLARWIDEGASWPDDAPGLGRRTSKHWSFQPITRPALPKLKNEAWPRNAIDSFILAKLEASGLAPSPEADPYTLIRRVYLDLTGLPPTPEEADAFVREWEKERSELRVAGSELKGTSITRNPEPGTRNSAAYDRLVDRLLASPHYGERWGRHWLDQARYADSNGYSVDSPRIMWPYRDWVIHALNADMPFDQFTIEQLAGDLLPNATKEQLVATGFHRNTMINQEGGTKDDQFRVEASYDRVATTSQVWLGLTLGCAQCHTHKFDPITQKEYYQFFAFFNSTEDSNNTGPTVALGTPAEEKRLAEVKAKLADAEKALKAVKEGKEFDGDRAAAKKTVDGLKKELSVATGAIPVQMVMRELKTPRPSHIHIRGDFLRPGPVVTPDVPEVLPPLVGSAMRNSGATSDNQTVRTADPTRLDLARWLVSKENPLPARVTMNRIWLHYFPRGLVETEEDFGTQGSPPSHPELLEWLASEFSGAKPQAAWSMKHMHKLIVMSATYRQSSTVRSDLALADPFNKLLGRQSRLRVEAEIIRDLCLASSGLLSRKIGGPSVRPPQPAGVYNFTQNQHGWTVSTGEDRYRRGMYTFFFRSAPHPMLTTFDVPNLTQTCTARMRSNTPLQSLTQANDEAMFEMAQALALRVMTEGSIPLPVREGRSDDAKIERLFRLCLTRKPDAFEASRLLKYLNLQRERFTKDAAAAKQVAPMRKAGEASESEAAAWTTLARAVINLDEFITRQ